MIRGAFQMLAYAHTPRYPWLDTLPAPVRQALREARPPEGKPCTIVVEGWLYRIHAPRVNLRSSGWRRWLASAAGQAWLDTPPGQRWLRGRGQKWADREGL